MEYTLKFKKFSEEMPEQGKELLVRNKSGNHSIASIDNEGWLESETSVKSMTQYKNFLWSYLPE